jgi:hypothetical protein
MKINIPLMILLTGLALSVIAKEETSSISQATCVKQMPVPQNLSNEFSQLLKQFDVNILIKEKYITPSGSLIIILNEDSVFMPDATLNIFPDQLEDLRVVIQNMKTIIKVTSKRNLERSEPHKIRLMDFISEDEVSVKHK